MVMVQRLKGDQKMFKEITEMLLAMALHEGSSSTRIDVVFDDDDDDDEDDDNDDDDNNNYLL